MALVTVTLELLIGDNMARFPFQYVNINGIPTIQTQSVTVTDTAVNFKFKPDWDQNPFRGLLLVYVAQEIPDGTTGTLPITFTMSGNTQTVMLPTGASWTAADLTSTGVYIVYYDRYSNVLQLID